MDIKEIAGGGLLERIKKEKELRKCLIREVTIEEEETAISTGGLLRGYMASKKICEDFFPREIRKISKIAIFDFGKISSQEVKERMEFLGFVPANIYETLIGLGKTDLKGFFFVSGSPLDPGETMTTFPMIKINGEKTITLNVDLKIEERFFVGVELVRELKEVV